MCCYLLTGEHCPICGLSQSLLEWKLLIHNLCYLRYFLERSSSQPILVFSEVHCNYDARQKCVLTVHVFLPIMPWFPPSIALDGARVTQVMMGKISLREINKVRSFQSRKRMVRLRAFQNVYVSGHQSLPRRGIV